MNLARFIAAVANRKDYDQTSISHNFINKE